MQTFFPWAKTVFDRLQPQYLSVFHRGTHHRQFQDQIHSLIQSWTVPAAHDCSYVWGPSSPVSHKQILLAGHLQSARRKLNYKVTGLQWASQMQGVTLVCFRQPDLKTHTESFHCDSYDKLQASVSRKPLQFVSCYYITWKIICAVFNVNTVKSRFYDCCTRLQPPDGRSVFVVPMLVFGCRDATSWCEVRRMHSWVYRLHRHPTYPWKSNTLSEK